MRVDNIREMMRNNGFDAVLVGTNANLYYLTGGVFSLSLIHISEPTRRS